MSFMLLPAMLALASPASAMCTGDLAALARYAGGDPLRFLEDPAVRSRATTLMGNDFTRLRTNLAVSGTVALIDCELVVEGNALHRGGELAAILSLSLYSGIMTVGMLDHGRVLIWSTPHRFREQGNYSHLPAHVRDWVAVAAGGFLSRGSPPDGASMVPPPAR
jgi:hypothetical protein